MTGGVFVLKDGTLVEMQSAQFAAEADFQQLICDFPKLLAGDQIDSTNPRRWVLVKREKSVPAEEGGSGRWSIDHLFLDQDGIPTLVEVKRQSDTRLRREVVGQMLDYAANGVAYWPVEEIIAEFKSVCAQSGKDPDETISELVEQTRSPEEFWQLVKTNLQAGRIRMLFLADAIPPELRRVVEFLNAQMDPAEVLALELQQFEGEGLRTLVPRVYGQTEEAQAKKNPAGSSGKHTWDEAAFFTELSAKCDPSSLASAKRLAAWIQDRADSAKFGTGAMGSMSAHFDTAAGKLNLLSLWTNGKASINFGYSLKPPFDDIELRRELLQRLNAVPGLNLRPGPDIDSYCNFPYSALVDPERMRTFLSALDWATDRIRERVRA
jgi:hypothetical protein